MKFKDLTGQRFGRLTVIERVGTRSGKSLWKCLCDCGNETEVRSDRILGGETQSCGCIRTDNLTICGIRGTRIYRIWHCMTNRCENKNFTQFFNYGGRGISVCNEWRDFLPFFNWAMASGYSETLTIDRIDNNGNYEPNNCKWSTRKEQNNNTRSNIWLEYQGKRKTLAQWAEAYGMPHSCLYGRIKLGWPIEKALFTPKQEKKVL